MWPVFCYGPEQSVAIVQGRSFAMGQVELCVAGQSVIRLFPSTLHKHSVYKHHAGEGLTQLLLLVHVRSVDARHAHRLRHGVTAEGLSQLLVQHNLDQSRLIPLHLSLDGTLERLLESRPRGDLDTLQAARLGHLGVLNTHVELRAHEVVRVPERRVALLGSPLVVAEHHHGDCGPLAAAARRQLVHGDAEGTITGEANHRHVRLANLGTQDRREAVAAWAEEPRREVLAALGEGWVGVANRAVVADVCRDDRIRGQRALDRAPDLARRHMLRVPGTSPLVPRGALIVLLMGHALELLSPCRLAALDELLTTSAVSLTRGWRKLCQDAISDLGSIALDANGDGLGQADACLVDVLLDELGITRPVVHATIGRQAGEGVQACAQGQNHIGLCHQLHARLRAVVAQGARVERVLTWESIIVLVVAADRRRQPLCKLARGLNAPL
mmetsp:Transcript_18601/g.47805  ORF Transcript_18601/g.47805 Transcript_18601/m.47805 type:complete len:442 (+) Transcript_18601:330-1655(+)